MSNIKNQILLDEYYKENAKKIRKMVDKILLRFGGISQKDYDDFYSLANEVFVDVLNKYDETKEFEGFLYSCLLNKIKSEITTRNRAKRKVDRLSISLDTPVGDEGEVILADVIKDDFDLEKEVLERNDAEKYSARMSLYLSKLSNLQREVLSFQAKGYSPKEIQNELQISKKEYSDCKSAICAYRNISILF